jgi:hypothetical protein
MNTGQYAVEFQEHDSTPWCETHLYTRAGAWKRVLACAAMIETGWPHPVWARVWRNVRTKDGQMSRVLVYTGDLRHIKSNT